MSISMREFAILPWTASLVDFIDTQGFEAISSNAKKFKASGGVLVVFGVIPDVRKILNAMGISKLFKIYPNEKEAVQALEALIKGK